MSFEIIDNTFQVIVLAAMALLAFLLAFRRSSRSCLILAFGYASFMMGTLYYLLHLIILGHGPQVFYVAECSWMASYFFFLSLGYNLWAWDGFAVFGGAVLDFEDFLVSNLFLPLGSLVYLLFCVSRYGWGWDNYKKEVNTGEGLKIHDWMRGYLTYGLPVIVLFIFAFGIYDKFFA